MRNYYRIYGDPVPYTAPKTARRRKRGGGSYTAFISPPQYVAWKKFVAQVVQGSWDYEGPMKGPVCLTLKFYLKRPKSSKRKVPDVKPDWDNLGKGVCDALKNDVLFHDDAQVVEGSIGKYYTNNDQAAGVEIKISEWVEDPVF